MLQDSLDSYLYLNTMAIQHPFNACLGPNEDQRRTLKLAATTAFFSMAIIGLLGNRSFHNHGGLYPL